MSRRWRGAAAAALWALALAACAGTQRGGGPGAARPQLSTEEKIADQKSRLEGDYSCRIELRDDVIEGPCTIRAQGESFVLAMQGKRALTGQVTATDAGFRLEGQLSCAKPDCKDPVSTDFFEQSKTEYRGVFAVESQGTIANAALIRP